MVEDSRNEVSPDCVVYRVVKKRDVKPDGTPHSSCFSDKASTDGSSNYMSVYFADEMEAAGKSVKDLQELWGSEYSVYSFLAVDLRAQGERLWRESNTEFPGHGGCKRADGSNRTQGQKRSLAKLAQPS